MYVYIYIYIYVSGSPWCCFLVLLCVCPVCLVTDASLEEMIAPGCLIMLSPVFVFVILILFYVHRRFLYKRDTSTHAEGTDPREGFSVLLLITKFTKL